MKKDLILFNRNIRIRTGKALSAPYGKKKGIFLFYTCPIIGWTFFRLLWLRVTIETPFKSL